MGMELLLVRLTPGQAEAVVANPELLRLVFPEDDQEALPDVLASLDIGADTLMEDYLQISEILDESVEEYEWMRKAASGTGSTIRFDFGYEGSDEAWPVLAVATFYREAAKQGSGIIGGVG